MSVHPSASQGYQYEVVYTGYIPVLNQVFLARNRILTRVAAKQAKTTKVKNKFVNGKKFKRIPSCLFGGRRKVQFRRKKLGDEVQAKSSNFPCPFCYELLRTRSTLNIAELVLFGFSAHCSQGTLFAKNSYTSQRQWDLLLSVTNHANTSKLYA